MGIHLVAPVTAGPVNSSDFAQTSRYSEPADGAARPRGFGYGVICAPHPPLPLERDQEFSSEGGDGSPALLRQMPSICIELVGNGNREPPHSPRIDRMRVKLRAKLPKRRRRNSQLCADRPGRPRCEFFVPWNRGRLPVRTPPLRVVSTFADQLRTMLPKMALKLAALHGSYDTARTSGSLS